MPQSGKQATITGLLLAAQAGDPEALDALFPLVYEELLALAHRERRRWQGNPTLSTTAIVHEAYLKLERQGGLAAQGRQHFFAVAARAMRHILCNYARDQRRQKRGGGLQRVSLAVAERAARQVGLSDDQADVLFRLDQALDRLEALEPRQGRIVECRFFLGLSIEETAAALGISSATVKRDWSLARAWLYRELQQDPDLPPAP